MTPEYVAKMEDVLSLYEKPYDPKYPVICFDEKLYQMLESPSISIETKRIKFKKEDCRYKRQGTCNLFMFNEPLGGWRDVKVTQTRTKKDFVECMRDLVDKYYPEAIKITLVMDNLNTHHLYHLYEFYPPEEAKRIIDKLEIHYTPKKASWLNMAEIEFSILSKQCLNQRIAYQEDVEIFINFWVRDRNSGKFTINWQFTTQDARQKLRWLYPKFQLNKN